MQKDLIFNFNVSIQNVKHFMGNIMVVVVVVVPIDAQSLCFVWLKSA